MIKKVFALVLSAAMVLGLAACGQSAAPAETTAAAAETQAVETTAAEAVEAATEAAQEAASGEKELKDITIAYVSGLLTNELIARQVQAMNKYAAEIGVKFINAPCEDEAAMISACENYVNMGVDCIISNVPTVEGMTDCMKMVQAAGIPFFAYDNPIEGNDASFAWNNYDYGWAIGMNAVDWINNTFAEGDTCYCYSVGYNLVDYLVVRENAYKDAINQNAKCKIEWGPDALGGNVANGVTAGENWLQAGQPINVVVGINDDGCLGVLEALNAANVSGDDIGFFAGDATDQAVATMASEPNGMYRGTVFTGLVDYADEFIDIAINLARGEKEHNYYGGLWFITPENAAAFQESKSADVLVQFKEYYAAD